MKKISFLIVLLFLLCEKSDAKKYDYLDTISKELDSFIAKVKPMTVKDGQYNVYVVTIRQKSNDELQLSINFINNEKRIDELTTKFYCERGNEFVLFDINRDYVLLYIKYFNLKSLNSNAIERIRPKLFPVEKGGITGRNKSLLINYKRDKFNKVFYMDVDQMPEDMQILKWPENARIEYYPNSQQTLDSTQEKN